MARKLSRSQEKLVTGTLRNMTARAEKKEGLVREIMTAVRPHIPAEDWELYEPFLRVIAGFIAEQEWLLRKAESGMGSGRYEDLCAQVLSLREERDRCRQALARDLC